MSLGLALELLDNKVMQAERISLEPGMEFFLPRTLRVSIADLAQRLVRTVGANITFWHSSFKRSELKVFCDAHVASLDHFYKNPLCKVGAKPIPVPEGLAVSYPKAAHTIRSLFDRFAFAHYLDVVHGVFSLMSAEMGDRSFDTAKAAEKLKIVFQDQLKEHDPEVITTGLQALFTTAKFTTRIASKEFKTKDQLRSTQADVLSFDAAYHAAFAIKAQVEQLNGYVATLVSPFEGKVLDGHDTAFLQALYQILMHCGHMVDKYGVLLHEAQRVEHNFVLCLTVIIAAKP